MIFKIDKTRFVTTPLLINGIVILLEFSYPINIITTIIILFCFNWFYFSTYWRKYLSEIEINTDLNTCRLTYVTNFTFQERKEYLINELKCGFETVTKARGIQIEVFRIFFKDLIIVEVTPSDGWSNDICIRIQKQLTSPYSPSVQ